MVSPINFILDTPDPLARVMEGFQAGTAIRRQPLLEQREAEDRARLGVVQGQQDQTFANQQTQFGQQQADRVTANAELERQRAEAVQMRKDIEALNDDPNANAADYARIIATYPDISTEMTASFNLLDESNKESTLLGLGEVYAAINSDNIEVADGLLNDRVEALRNSGRTDEAAKTEAMLAILEADPEAAKTSIGLAIKTLGGTQFDSLLDTASTVQTSTAYGNGTVHKVMRDGTTQVTNPSGEVVTGEAAAQTIADANAAEVAQRGDIKGTERTEVLGADINLGAKAAQVKAEGAILPELALEARNSYTRIRTNIANYDLALDALDEGAAVGAFMNLVPSVTQASIDLDNIRNRLGLDIIGAATFGALSKGELDLALSTGLPTNKSEEGLRKWITERRDAQIKLANELRGAAAYLSKRGSTLEGYFESIGFVEGPAKSPDFEAVTEGTGTLSPAAQALLESMGDLN